MRVGKGEDGIKQKKRVQVGKKTSGEVRRKGSRKLLNKSMGVFRLFAVSLISSISDSSGVFFEVKRGVSVHVARLELEP